MKTPFANDAERTAKGKRRLLMLIFLVALVAGIAAHLLWPGAPPPGGDPIVGGAFPGNGEAVEGHLPNMSKESVREQMQREADRNVFAFKINSRPVFDAGTGEGTLRIENPNHNTYPFVVKIFLDETEEELYNSGGILPNHHINTARLTRILPSGEHTATAYIYAYNPDTYEYGGKSAVALTLIVKE